ncbi:MAG: DUF1194 domain-containing protein, partial [Alphaproteobacteria bacterium]
MHIRGLLLGFCMTCALAPSAAGQETGVDLELALVVDSSGSVDEREFDLQLRGLADAFRDRDVIAAINAHDKGIATALVQWSGPRQQSLSVDWFVVSDQATAEMFARRIGTAERRFGGVTAIGEVLRFSGELLQANRFAGRRRVIDLSGDGPTNFGEYPGGPRDRVIAAGITVNGLAIVNEFPELSDYYAEHVIGGDGAFVMTATDYRDFARAMRV